MNLVSLFSGCGGLDLGFEQAGFNIIWANEFDKGIHDTYKANHPNTTLCEADIRSVDAKDIPDCDGIIGGPPCQAWSEGGKRRGLNDERGKVFLDYIRIVRDKKPKFFIIENVAGILDECHRESFEMFLSMLEEAGYTITYELLNCADFQIPQDRFRVFIVGLLKSLDKKFVFPDNTDYHKVDLWRAIGDLPANPSPSSGTPNDELPFPNHEYFVGDYDAKFMSRNRVRSWDEQSFTIQALAKNSPLHPQAPKMEYLDNFRRRFVVGKEHLYRRLSVRECARIQTFPDKFKFIYKDIKEAYKMIGNAVPPRMAKILALAIRDQIGIDSKIEETPKGLLLVSIPKSRNLTIVNKLLGYASELEYYFGTDFEAHPSFKYLKDCRYLVPVIGGKISAIYTIQDIFQKYRHELPEYGNKERDYNDRRWVCHLSNLSYLKEEHLSYKIKSGILNPRRWNCKFFSEIKDLFKIIEN